MKRVLYSAVSVVVAITLASCKGPSGQGEAPSTMPAAPATTGAAPASPEPQADRPVPERPALVVTTFDGAKFDLAQHRGRWVVVNFWATWCNPCLKEIPDLAAMDAAREDIDVIGLAYEEIERPDMQAFLKGRPIAYPIAIVDTFGPPTDFGTPRGLPTTFLIDPEGKVAATHLGPVTSQELLREIDAGKTRPGKS
jgi:thiol-disulfide isomerase/thioredoxin